MTHTYEELSKMNVAELRKIADTITHEAVQGHSVMHKEKLLPALCKALGIEGHVHHHVVGINKAKVKLEIRLLKKQRDAAVAAKDYSKLENIRQQLHTMKGKLRRAIV